MAEAATTEINKQQLDTDFYEIVEASRPWAIDVTGLEIDREIRYRAAQFIGRVTMQSAVQQLEVQTGEKPINSLRDGIQMAARGDKAAQKLVETNVATDVIERTIKTGHVMDPIHLDLNAEGKIVQYDQTADSIHANSLQLAADNPIMRARTEAETRNSFRIEDAYKDGWFEDHSLVVFSLAEDMPDVFFTETMSCSIQVTSKSSTGLQLESAFVAGVAEPGAGPHDMGTIVKVGDALGVDFRGKTKAEILDTPVLIPNKYIQNGAIDMVKLWDAACGGFFGENKQPPMGYADYREFCRERTKTFQPKVEHIRDRLIAEAPHITTRLQAVERLHQLSEEQMVLKAIEDRTIDPRVFGPGAQHIIDARILYEQGEIALAEQATSRAIQTAESRSCPTAMRKEQEAKDGENASKANKADEDEYGPLEFQCTKGHTNRRPRGKLITQCRIKSCKNSVGCG
jgi:hypothetical protein